jgi:hypothetical protein
MSSDRRSVVLLLMVACMAWHMLAVLDHWRQAHREQHGRDFASYYYAVDVGFEGGNPYDKRSLGASSRDDETRKSVHPFFYPPPFVLVSTWMRPLDLVTAYRVWFWLDEAFLWLSLLVLARWWRPLGELVPVSLALMVAALTAIPNNHLMGQANLPVLLLVLLALKTDEEDRTTLAGALMGLACMLKMSPALFVAWWLLRGRWASALWSCVAAVVYSLLTLPLVGIEHQWHFYTAVLPGFGSGDYNGLAVGIDLFGNHSLPNLYDGWFPNPAQRDLSLSGPARVLSSLSLVALVAATGWLLRAAPADRLARAGHVGAVGAVMLLVPVFTYEHHLVWLMPAAVVSVVALGQGRLSPGWAAPIGLALTAWCFDLTALKTMHLYVTPEHLVLGAALREAKFAAIVVLYAANMVVARSAPPAGGPT